MSGYAIRYKNFMSAISLCEKSNTKINDTLSHAADISLVLSKGIIHKHEITVPYINIQDVEREQNILDIIAGVCTIKVETAGSVSANIEIPGIDMNDNVDMIILEKKQEILEKQKKKSVEEEHKKEDEMLSDISDIFSTSSGDENDNIGLPSTARSLLLPSTSLTCSAVSKSGAIMT